MNTAKTRPRSDTPSPMLACLYRPSLAFSMRWPRRTSTCSWKNAWTSVTTLTAHSISRRKKKATIMTDLLKTVRKISWNFCQTIKKKFENHTMKKCSCRVKFRHSLILKSWTSVATARVSRWPVWNQAKPSKAFPATGTRQSRSRTRFKTAQSCTFCADTLVVPVFLTKAAICVTISANTQDSAHIIAEFATSLSLRVEILDAISETYINKKTERLNISN